MGENSIERDTQALIRGGNSPKRWTHRANSSQIAGCGTGEREAPGGNRTAFGPVYKEKVLACCTDSLGTGELEWS